MSLLDVPKYRDNLTDWATWRMGSTNVPEDIHCSSRGVKWSKLLDWLSDMCPTPNTEAAQIQKYLLVAGIVIRDIHIVNSIEEDCEVPDGGAEYLRASTSTFSNLPDRIYPILKRAHRPMTDSQPVTLGSRRSSSADEVRNLIDERMTVDASTPTRDSLPSQPASVARGDMAVDFQGATPTTPDGPRPAVFPHYPPTGTSSAGPSKTLPERSQASEERPEREGHLVTSSTGPPASTVALEPGVGANTTADHVLLGPPAGNEPYALPPGPTSGAVEPPKPGPSAIAEAALQPFAANTVTGAGQVAETTKGTKQGSKKQGGRKKAAVPANAEPVADPKGKGKAADIPVVGNVPVADPAVPENLRRSTRVRKPAP